MPDEDKRPSLEPPKLFGRRRKDAPADADPEPSDEPTAAVPVPAPEPDPIPEPVREPVREPAPEPAPEPVREPVRDAAPEPTKRRAPLPDDFGTARDEPPVARTLVTGAPLFADEMPADTEPEADVAVALKGDEDDDQSAPGRRAKSRRVPLGPVITGYPASALTGLLVGALMVGLTVASLKACEQVRGTSTCGGPGLLILVIILVVLVMVGQVLLKLLRVPDPGSTSFLAVGLIAVVALLFLIDVILDWQMLIVIPLIGIVAFLLSHWVTTAFVEPTD
jgi:hypothetical protein